MIEKILERLREKRDKWLDVWSDASITDEIEDCFYADGMSEGFLEAMKIVQEVAKDGGWIPCSELLPEHMQQCLTTARIYFIPDHVDEPNNYIGVELNTYSKNHGWLGNSNVIAWQPLPAPYQKGE